MRIGIIGPGALGCLFATRLFSASNEQDAVLLIDHNPERAKLLNRQGILYESNGEKQVIPVPVHSKPEDIAPLDILFSCVKSYDLQRSLKFARALLPPSTLLIFLQNGIGHLKYNDSKSLRATPVFATSSEGATRLGAGHILHAGSGHTTLGFLSPQSKAAETTLQQLLVLLQNSRLASSLTDDMRATLWAKLFVNVGINGLTVLHNCSNGELLSSAAARERLKELVNEAEQVARAAQITVYQDPIQATLDICERTAHNTSSMLQDVRNLRPTEIDAINGAVSQIAKELDIPTPQNDKLIAQIKQIEARYLTNQ